MVLQPNLVSGCTLIQAAFQCTKFQGNQIMPLCSYFHTFTKRKKKKNEKTLPTFEGSYLRNAQRDLVEIWHVRWWRWLAFPSAKISFIKVSLSYIYVKIALLFFLLITHGCGAPASWAAWHTTVCLDVYETGDISISECTV